MYPSNQKNLAVTLFWLLSLSPIDRLLLPLLPCNNHIFMAYFYFHDNQNEKCTTGTIYDKNTIE